MTAHGNNKTLIKCHVTFTFFFFFYLTAKTAYKHYDGLITIADFFSHFFKKKKQFTTTKDLQYVQKKERTSISGATLFVATPFGYGWRISHCCRTTLCCGSAGEQTTKKKYIKIGKYDLQRRPPPCMVYGTT